MGKRKGRHAGDNNPWKDAARRAGRAIRPVAVRVGGAAALGITEGVADAVASGLLK